MSLESDAIDGAAESVARTNGTKASKAAKSNQGRRGRRPGPTTASASPTLAKKNLRKVFPDHWSFMLGEIALWSFVVLLLTGVFLTLWFRPSMVEVVYDGSYDQLRGIQMSEAYASSLHLSFDVRGGLLMRQMHHWAAMMFVAAMMVHLLRVFFTGAFRKPRELNWVIGSPAAAPRHARGLHRLLAARRPALRHRHPRRRRLHEVACRWSAPTCRSSSSAASSRVTRSSRGSTPIHVLLIPGILLALIARPHAAARLPQAHAVARARPHRAERRRLPDAARLRRQGRRVLLHRLRRARADGRRC